MGDMPFMGALHIASRAGALLENLQSARVRTGVSKNWTQQQVEDYLDEIARVHGNRELNQLRDQARQLARSLKLTADAFLEPHEGKLTMP